MNNSSFTSVEKIIFNSNNKNNYIQKGKLIRNYDGNIKLVILNLRKSKFIKESIKLIENNTEEFLDSETTNSKLNSINNNSIQEIESKNIKKYFIQNKNKSEICLLIDKIINSNEDLKNYKKYSLMTITKLENNSKSSLLNFLNKKNKNINISNSIDIIEDNCIENLFNLINKNDLLNTTCSICLQNFDINHEISLIKICLHIFHYYCLNNWIGVKGYNQNNCPYCKSLIDPNIN